MVKKKKLFTIELEHFVSGVQSVNHVLINRYPDKKHIIAKKSTLILASLLLLRKRKRFISVEHMPQNKWVILTNDENMFDDDTVLFKNWLSMICLTHSSKKKIFYPFWNNRCMEISNDIWLPTQNVIDSKSNSWALSQIIENTNLTYSSEYMFISREKCDEKSMRARKIRIYPNKTQSNKLKNWFGTSRYVYNQSLNYVRTKGNKELNFYQLRDKFVTAKNNPTLKEWELLTPKDVRAGAIKDMVNAYKTAFLNLKRGNIRQFKINYRCKKKDRSIEIPKTAISYKDGSLFIYKKYLNSKIKKCKETIPEIKYDCRLQWERKQWYLIIPIDVECKDSGFNKTEACALDPGSRKFQTIYSENKVEIVRIRKDQIKKLQNKLDKMKSLRDKKIISRKRYKNRENRIYNKLDHLIDDMHFKTINSLVKNYQVIFLPIFESQEIVRKNKYGNRNLLQVKHYRFRMRLAERCKIEKETRLVVCTEEYTSKTCTRCGSLNDVGSSEVYQCSNCDLIIDRDVNGARNIFIKCVNEMM